MNSAAENSRFARRLRHALAAMPYLWLHLALLSSLACDRDHRESERAPSGLIDCSTAGLPCDVRAPGCQALLFQLTACIREQPEAIMPPVALITRAELAQQLQVELSSGAPPTLEERALDVALPLLGLAREGAAVEQVRIEQLVEGVAAFYDEDEQTVSVLEDVVEEDPDAAIYLVHEFVHALQDQREGLEDLDESNASFDRKLATLMLDEGEAVLIEQLAYLTIERHRPRRSNLVAPWSELLPYVLDDIVDSDAPLTLTYDSLAYPVGGAELGELYLARGMAGIRAEHAAPRERVLDWVVRDAPAPEPLACRAPSAPAGLTLLGTDQLGVGGVLALAGALGMAGEEAYAFARSLRNDELVIYGGADVSQVALSYRLLFASEGDASSLGVLAGELLSAAVTQHGRELWIVAANDRALLESMADDTSCAKRSSPVRDGWRNLLSAQRRPLRHAAFRENKRRSQQR